MYFIVKNILSVLIIFCSLTSFSQARLVLNNGGIIRITDSAFLVIDNPSPNAITRISSGHIISEGLNNRVKWNIGNSAASYVIPFGIGIGEYLPVSLTTAAASGAAGSLIFSMYPVGSWLNSSNLPPVVTNFVNNYSTDNSAFAVDRFWRIEPNGYTAKPMLSNLEFTYRDPEWSTASNTILESNLIAQRYNDSLNAWNDYMPGTVTNTVVNTSTVANLPSSELFTWWTLVDNRFVLPVELTSFTAICKDSFILVNWQTASETNTDFFEVERSTDGIHFYSIGQITAAFNSTSIQEYTLKDGQPLNEKAYYRLKQVDKDGSQSYSSLVMVDCKSMSAPEPHVSIYPNPATDELTIDIKGVKGKKTLLIYDITGRQMIRKVMAGNQSEIKEFVNVSNLANATYLLRVDVDEEMFQVIKFLKK